MKFFSKLLSNTALSGTIIVTIGIFIGSVFSYLLQLVLGRLLSVADFGTFNALLSVSVILMVLNAALSTSLIKLVSELKAKEKSDTLTHLFRDLTFYFLLVGVGVFLLVYLLRGSFSTFLHIYDFRVLTVFGVLMGVTFVAIMPLSYFQGLLRFKAFAFWSIVRSIFRFALPAGLVFFGFGLVGVFFGMSIAVICSFAVALLLLWKNFEKFGAEKLQGYYKKLVLFTGPVLFVQVGMTFLNNSDVILVKHFFDEVTAGLYSGVVTVGKVLLFGAGTVGVVMFPQVSAAFTKKEDYIAKFKPFLYLQFLIVVVGVLFFALFPSTIVKIMFGERYLPAVPFVARFSVFVGLYVLINFLVLFFLAIEKTKVVLFQAPAILGQLLLIYFFHSSINQVINVNILISFILFAAIMLYYLFNVSFHNRSGL